MNNAAPTNSHGIEIDLARSARRHAIMQRVTDIYCRCGYSPYTLPLIDTHRSYANMLDSTDSLRSFRFVNNDGELMILRPDSTLFLVRHIAHTLQRDHLPLRVWYGESVLRNFSRAEGGIIEQYQSGVELIGKDDIEAEIEMLLFVRKTMRTLELDDSIIHFGSRRMLRCVLMDCPEAQYRVVVNAVLRRDVRQLPALFMQEGYSQKEAEDLTAFFMYIGSMPPPAPALRNTKVVHALKQELAQMKQIINTVHESMAVRVPSNKQQGAHEGVGRTNGEGAGQGSSEGAGQTNSEGAWRTNGEGVGRTNGEGAGQGSSGVVGQASSGVVGQTNSNAAGQASSDVVRQAGSNAAGQTHNDVVGQANGEGAWQASSGVVGQGSSEGAGQTNSEGARQANSEGVGRTNGEGARQVNSNAAGWTDSDVVGQASSNAAGRTNSDVVAQVSSEGAGKSNSEGVGRTNGEGAWQANSEGAGQANHDAGITGSTQYAIRQHIDTIGNPAINTSVHIASDNARTASIYKDDIRMTDYTTDVCIDLSEVGDRQYYTGFVFAVYHPEIADKIAAGGRYDTLFGMYGFDVSSIGFTVYIHRYEAYLDTPLQNYMDIDIANATAGIHP